jgi:hypothetical protein
MDPGSGVEHLDVVGLGESGGGDFAKAMKPS